VKWLPCATCGGGAYGGATKPFPEGEPLLVGRLSYFPFRYKCSRCKRVNSLTAAEWNQLATLDPKTIAEMGLPGMVS
jgi:hypothetical protein